MLSSDFDASSYRVNRECVTTSDSEIATLPGVCEFGNAGLRSVAVDVKRVGGFARRVCGPVGVRFDSAGSGDGTRQRQDCRRLRATLG